MALTTVPASLSATALTLTTAAQPNITSVGTLTGLTVSGNIAGTLTTAAQTNITSLGTLTGLTVGGTISIGDWTNAINIGASNDLQLYHVGGNSHIKSDTGQLIIRTDALRVLNNANSEQILHGDADGAVTLYYDNAAKLATASGGVTVTGTLTATTLAGTLSTAAQTNITSVGTLTGLTSSGSIQTTGASTYFISNSSSSGDYIRIYAGSGTGKWDIYGNGANLRFSDNDGAGGVYFDREIGIRNAPDSNYALKLLQNQSLTHGGYFQINGGTATGLEINATSGSFSGTALYVRESSVTTGGYLARFANSAGDKVTIATDGTATFGGRINFAEHIIGSANGGYIQFRGTGNRYWVIGSTGGNTVPTTASATLGFHHYDGSSWTQNRFNITAGGNVGIGTSNPNALLDVGGGNIADPTIRIDSASGGDPTLIFDASQANRSARIKFYDNGSNVGGFIDYLHNGDKMNFGAGSSATATMTVGDGKVGIGTSSPGALLDLETAGNTNDGTYYSTITINNTGSSTYSRLRFDRNGSARWGIGLMPDDKFQIGKLYNTANDNAFVMDSGGHVGIGRVPSTAVNLDIQDESSSTLAGLRIRNRGQVAGSAVKAIWSLNRNASDVDFEAGSILVGKQQNWTATASTVDAYMAFSTTENESVYERMRLHPGGSLTVGSDTTSHTDETKTLISPNGGGFQVYNMAATNEWWIWNNLANQSGYTTKVDFRVQNSSKGYIGITGSTVIYYSNSDYRLKENYNYDFDATSLVKAMKPLEFTWKEEPMVGKQMGFLAHELKEVTPYVVQGDKDEMRDDGEIRPQVVDQGKLVAVLTKALQEALVRIETLETEVTALKG